MTVENRLNAKSGHFLENHFLIAMPAMEDDRFARSVIYVCAHSDEGAMGLIINQPQQLMFPDLLVQLGRRDEAHAAYTAAKESLSQDAAIGGLQMKLDDLARGEA